MSCFVCAARRRRGCVGTVPQDREANASSPPHPPLISKRPVLWGGVATCMRCTSRLCTDEKESKRSQLQLYLLKKRRMNQGGTLIPAWKSSGSIATQHWRLRDALHRAPLPSDVSSNPLTTDIRWDFSLYIFVLFIYMFTKVVQVRALVVRDRK